MIPTPFALLVVLAGLFSSGRNMPGALLLCTLLGAAAAIELPSLGGAPITPAVMLLPFLVWRALRDEGIDACAARLAYPQAGFWLLMLMLWGVLSAWFLPRLFIGQTLLYGTDRSTMQGVLLMPLQPLSTNLTQSAYALAGLAAFAALGALLAGPGRLARFGTAVLLLAGVNCAAGLLNLAEMYLGLPSLLELVRNARYAIMTGGEVGGLQRISGTFAETAAFSAYSLPLLAFTASLWRDGVQPRLSGALALTTLLLLLMSTSSTAYVSLGVYLALLLLAAAWSAVAHARGPQLGAGTWLLWAVAVAACVLLLVRPQLATAVGDFFGTTLIRKLETSSGIERGSWNTQAWRNFVEVHGVGVGLGSARASSFVLVLLSNLGVLGALLFLAFLARLLLAPDRGLPDDAAPVARAARHAVVAALIAASVAATVFDLGLAFYAFAAAAAARRAVPHRHATTRGQHVPA